MKLLSPYFLWTSLGLILFCSTHALAQFEENYTPRSTYSQNSTELIKTLEKQLKATRNSIESSKKVRINGLYKKRTEALVRVVKNEGFIQDDTLNHILYSVLENINRGNTINSPIKTVLLSRSPDVNAYCVGEGTVILNVGLLARIENESQLGFVLSHEMAHYELEHSKNRTLKYFESNQAKTAQSSFKSLLEGDINPDEAAELRNWVNNWGRYSRGSELEADSLGYLLFAATKYHHDAPFEVLNMLDSALYPTRPLGDRLFQDLDFKNYPFKKKWLQRRLGIYSMKPSSLVFNDDSLLTHPDIDNRVAKLANYHTERYAGSENIQSLDLMAIAKKMAQFETVESAFFSRRYDVGLYEALQLKSIYPANRYLTSVIGKILINLYENFDFLGMYVPKFTGEYSEELRMVNNFLHNLTKQELGEVAFHFLNNKQNFNMRDDEHYYLLWKVCDLTSKNEVKIKIKESYQAKFPGGKHNKRMK